MPEKLEKPVSRVEEQVPDSVQPPQESRGAREEKALFDEGAPENRAESGELRRSEQFQDAIHRMRVASIYTFWVFVVIFAVIMSIHYLGPEGQLWMTEQQVDRIEAALSGSVITAAVLLLRRSFSRN